MDTKIERISALEELCVYADNNEKLFSVYSTFSGEDMEYLESDFTDTPEYKLASQKYSLYLYEIVDNFERGPHGLKRNLDKDGMLKVLNEEDSDRLLLLARDYTRNLLQACDHDEFQILFDRYDDTLRKMAIKAQERGLVCFIPQTKEQDQAEQHLMQGGLRLRRRGPVHHN